MRRAFFFILAVLFANASFASIPRASLLDDAPAIDTPSAETRVWASDVLAPFERQAESELTRALRQAYEHSATTNASGLGRFLSVDIAPGRPKEPLTWNRYSYAGNNPLKYIDPTGLYFVVANSKDRQFFANAIAAGTGHKSSREMFLRLANDPRPIYLERRNFGHPRDLNPARMSTFPANYTAKPAGAVISLDPRKYDAPNAPKYMNATVSVFHEIWHTIDAFYLGWWALNTYGDVSTPESMSVFETLGYWASTRNDDPSGRLSPAQVEQYFHSIEWNANWQTTNWWDGNIDDWMASGASVWIDGVFVGRGIGGRW